MQDAKVIVIIMGGTSAMNASLSLCKLLSLHGYRLIYLGLPRFREYIEMQGFEFHTFEPMNFGEQKKYKKNIPGRFQHFRRIMRHRLLNRDYVYTSAEKWLEQIRPVLVLLDSNLYNYSVPFFRKKVPIISVSITLSSFYVPRRPPVFAGIFPAKSTWSLSMFNIQLHWMKILLLQYLRDTRENMAFRIGFGTGKFLTTAKKVKELGGVLKRSEYDLRLVVPEIVLGPACIDFPVRDIKRVKLYAGSCVFESRKEVDFDFSLLDSTRPLIYCAMGTASLNYKHGKKLYRCLFETMRRLPEYQLVLQTQGLGSMDVYGQIPENVKIFARTPQLTLLKRAALFITHGGFSSVREGALSGVPMIVFPGWHDQPGNAVRVVYHGLGKRGNMKKITTDALIAMISDCINNQQIRLSLQRIQKQLVQSNELENCFRFIENFIQEKGSVDQYEQQLQTC